MTFNLSVCFSGLENIFLLTMRKKNELRVDMEDLEGGKASAQYSSFSIDSENGGYQLHLGSFAGGDAGENHWVGLNLGILMSGHMGICIFCKQCRMF